MDRICNILVVEYDDAVRDLLGDVLEMAGYRFTLVGSGSEMRRALDADEFDVAIIDISLRGGENGFALGEVAREHGCGVILTTGDPEQQARIEAVRHSIIKPFRIQQLTDLIDQVVRENGLLCTARPPGGGSPLSVGP